jgi:pimeloyl-ACP methyl ester carboxylesterase
MHALVPGSTLVVVDGAGHMPTLERPEAVTEAIGTWLYA